MTSSEQKGINDLADEDLPNIFKHLPPYERLIVSEVSKRWYGISRIPWRDVSHLDISPIPGENIGAIVKLCPNLRTVFAKGKAFSPNQPHLLSGENLSSINLYQCSTVIHEQPGAESTRIPVLPLLVSADLANAPLKELVLCHLNNPERDSLNQAFVIDTLPASLELLQIIVAELIFPQRDLNPDLHCANLFVDGLGQLRQLTCLSLHTWYECGGCEYEWEVDLRQELGALQNLRELSIDGDVLGFDLPRLEVLFLNDVVFHPNEAHFENLATKHPALRILCITGSFDKECIIPERRLFPNGFGSNPVPPLKVFIGKEPSEKILFTKSPADTLTVYPITEPLPEFLEKEKIAPLFEEVWLAAQIKEGAKHGSDWWKYQGDTATSFRTADDA